MFTIGSLHPLSPFLLAPMAGYTQLPFRELCLSHGAGLCYTELTVAEGIARQLPPTMLYLETSSQDHPIGAHIYGCNPDSMGRAAAIIEQSGRFDLVDINAGCPVRKLTSKGCGAALMKNPELIYRIIRAMKEQTHGIPITLKTRIGLSSRAANIHEVADAAQQAGADAITVHARFACNRHKGPADWDVLQTLKKQLRIPLIGNGGANSAHDAVRMLQETGVDAVLIGRAALGNPWIFEEAEALLNNQPWTPPTHEQRNELMLRHADATIAMVERAMTIRSGKTQLTAEQAGCRLFRAHLVHYLAGCPGLKAALRAHNQLSSISDLHAILESIQ